MEGHCRHWGLGRRSWRDRVCVGGGLKRATGRGSGNLRGFRVRDGVGVRLGMGLQPLKGRAEGHRGGFSPWGG